MQHFQVFVKIKKTICVNLKNVKDNCRFALSLKTKFNDSLKVYSCCSFIPSEMGKGCKKLYNRITENISPGTDGLIQNNDLF